MTRCFAAVVCLIAAVALAQAQPEGTYSKATLPDPAVVGRLNLKTEWSQYIPIAGVRDGLAQVQTIDDQVFVQTKAGILVALDAGSGRIQWMARLGEGGNANVYPVAANKQYVFAVHVTRLYGFHRYSGVAEFATDIDVPGMRQRAGAPSVGLAADDRALYVVLGSSRMRVYGLPNTVAGPADPLRVEDKNAKGATQGGPDALPKRSGFPILTPELPTLPPVQRVETLQLGKGVDMGRTPSLQSLPRVTPPYRIEGQPVSPSLTSVGSLRPPYQIRTEAGRYTQQTASLSTLPPSVSAALMLTDLRPKSGGPEPWGELDMSLRALYPPLLTPKRVWIFGENGEVQSINRLTEKNQALNEASERLVATVAALPAAAGEAYYVPMSNGAVVAVTERPGGGAMPLWRAAPGGINNHTPFVTKTHVYASGDNGGVVCMYRFDGPYKNRKGAAPKADAPKEDAPKADPKDAPPKADEAPQEAGAREYLGGDIVWRSDDSADHVIGANDEFVYVRDRQGRLMVFDAARPTAPPRLRSAPLASGELDATAARLAEEERKRSSPLGTINLGEFNVPVMNTVSDRVYLAADNGLIVCLRDAKAKYNRPVRIWPTVVEVPPPPKKAPEPKKEP